MSETEEMISRTPLGEVVAAERALTRAHVALARGLSRRAQQALRIVAERTACIDAFDNTLGGADCCFLDVANELLGLGLVKRMWEDEPESLTAELRGLQVARVLPVEEGE